MKKLISILFIVLAFQGFGQTMKIDKEINNVTVDVKLNNNYSVSEQNLIIDFYYDLIIYLHGQEIATANKIINIPLDKTKSIDYHKDLFWNKIKEFLILAEGDYIIVE